MDAHDPPPRSLTCDFGAHTVAQRLFARRNHHSRSRMRLVVHGPQPSHRDVGVQLRRRQRGVPEQFLHNAKIGTAFEQMRCGAVA